MTGNGNYIAELHFGAPKIYEEAFVAPTAVVVGAVTLGARASIWYGAVARADEEVIVIGPGLQRAGRLHPPLRSRLPPAGRPGGHPGAPRRPPRREGRRRRPASAWAAS